MEIQTNRVTATFDFSAIAKDFTIFRVFSSREPGQWKQWNQDVQTYCVLDAPVITWKALATAYGSQFETLVLFAAGTVDVPQEKNSAFTISREVCIVFARKRKIIASIISFGLPRAAFCAFR